MECFLRGARCILVRALLTRSQKFSNTALFLYYVVHFEIVVFILPEVGRRWNFILTPDVTSYLDFHQHFHEFYLKCLKWEILNADNALIIAGNMKHDTLPTHKKMHK